MSKHDRADIKAKAIMDWLQDEWEEAYCQSSAEYDEYFAKMEVLNHAKILFSPDSYIATESAADIWRRFARNTEIIFVLTYHLMTFIKLLTSGLPKNRFLATDWRKAAYLTTDIRKTLTIMCRDKVAPEYVLSTNHNDPIFAYYESWNKTVGKVYDFIKLQDIPSIEELNSEDYFIFNTEEEWCHIMMPREDGFIEKVLPSDISDLRHSVIWTDVSDTQKDVNRERRRLMKADSNCPLAFNLPDKKHLEDYIESEINTLAGKEDSVEEAFLSSFIVFLKNKETDEKKILKMLYNIRNGLSLFDTPLLVLKDGTESKKNVLDLVQLIHRLNKDRYIYNDVGFFSPNLTAMIRLLHHFTALPLSKDDKLGERRRKALDTVISNIETCIINLDQRCDTIDDYYTETDFYWERLFYPDNDYE